LAGHFKLWGRVISANVSKDFDKKKTNVDLGYGFVEFATIEEAEEALKFPRQNINGNICEVKLSQSGSNDKWKIPGLDFNI
jgi:RNA recognition motif-containing protein